MNEGKAARKGFVYVASSVAALGGLLFGYDTGVISGALLFVKRDFALSAWSQELVVSAVLAGAIVGAISAGLLADRFGRRLTVILTAGVFTLGAIAAAFAPSPGWLILARVVLGMAIGVASCVTPLYLSEISPPKIRGALVSLNQLAITVGILGSYLVDYAFAGSGQWRWMFGLAVVPALLLGLGMLFLPESARWLMKQGRGEDARHVLERIRPAVEVDGEYAAILASLKEQEGGMRELMAPSVRRMLFLGVSLAVLQQVTGINTVIYYAPTILQQAGFGSAAQSILATAGVGVINVLMTVVAVRYLDRLGRRRMLYAGVVGMVVALAMLTVAFALPRLGTSLGWLTVAGLMIYVAAFAIGLGPVFWLLISEIFPLKVRGLGMSVASLANWGANLIVALTFLSLVHGLGPAATFALYGLVGLGTLGFIKKYVPETTGKSLEELELGLHTREPVPAPARRDEQRRPPTRPPMEHPV